MPVTQTFWPAPLRSIRTILSAYLQGVPDGVKSRTLNLRGVSTARP